MIDRAPEVAELAVDLHQRLIQMPAPGLERSTAREARPFRVPQRGSCSDIIPKYTAPRTNTTLVATLVGWSSPCRSVYAVVVMISMRSQTWVNTKLESMER